MKVRLWRGQTTRDDEVLAALQGELGLLREENARLQAERGRPLDPGRVADDVRVLAAAAGQVDACGDDAWHVLTEALVLREALLDLCQGVELAMVTLADRLQALAPSAIIGSLVPAGEGERQ